MFEMDNGVVRYFLIKKIINTKPKLPNLIQVLRFF
jgi:hypothetical protein